jgi:hypothetical protein
VAAGLCLASLAPGSLVPITAFAAAAACGVVLRSVYDLANPIPVGDAREAGRLLGQWCMALGLFILLWLLLQALAGGWFAPDADDFGPVLRGVLVLTGAVLALRAVVRMQVKMWRTPHQTLRSIPEFDSRPQMEEVADWAPAKALEPMEPDRPLVSRGDLPGFIAGVLLVTFALEGWDMHSLCLLHLS